MRKIGLWLIALSLLAFIAGVGVVLNPFQPESVPVPPAPAAPSEAQRQREVILYFAESQPPFLSPELGRVAEFSTEEQGIFAVVRALAAGSQQQRFAVLPAQAVLLNVEIVDGVARLDFNQALLTFHPGGSSSELLTVRALINTLAANFPQIRELVLLVDGKPLETLRGHIDLRRPVVADFSLVRQEAQLPVTAPLPQDAGEQIE